MPSRKATLIENIPFTIDPVRVMREMKIPASVRTLGDIPEKPVADAIRTAIDVGYSLIRGRGIYKTFPLDGIDGDAVVGSDTGRLFAGRHMVKLLGECPFATLQVSTIGPELEGRVQSLQDAGELTAAFALEMVGGWMADYMAERVDERVEREMRRAGFAPTMRFSAGYGDWALSNQRAIVALAEGERLGVAVTDSDIMIPRKSVSAVIGWKPEA